MGGIRGWWQEGELTIRWFSAAVRDRLQHLDYISEHDPSASLRIDEQISQQLQLLSRHPLMGRTGRVSGTRELVIARSPFLLVHRMHSNEIQVVRMLHGAQQWPPVRAAAQD